jgi:hypothetical protein
LISSLYLEFEEELGTDEESGKDWSELEEEATMGRKLVTLFWFQNWQIEYKRILIQFWFADQ